MSFAPSLSRFSSVFASIRLLTLLYFFGLRYLGKIQQIICTGNVCDKETHEYLRSIAPEIHVVRGDYDEVRSRLHLPSFLPSLLSLQTIILISYLLPLP